MNLSVHLADAAQPDQFGKVSALGLGWSQIATPMPPHALVVFVEFDPSDVEQTHPFSVDLVDEDGQTVMVGGEQAFHGEGGIQMAMSMASAPGAPVVQAMAFPVPPGIALPPGRRWAYRVRCGDAFGSATFATRAA
ncbi:MAG: hypothetical protein ABI435_10290 [Pseudolysinimonas sp.]